MENKIKDEKSRYYASRAKKRLTYFLIFLTVGIITLFFSVFVGVLIIFFVLAIFFNRKNNDQKLRKKDFQIIDANEYIATIKESKALPTISTSLLLQDREDAFLEENTTMFETRSVRKSTGGFGGVRVSKRISVGGYSGTSESRQEWRAIDTGKITITDKRFIFDGTKGNKSVELKKLINLDVFSDSINLSIDGRSKDMQFKVSNPYIWAAVIRIIKSVPNPNNLEGIDLNVELV